MPYIYKEGIIIKKVTTLLIILIFLSVIIGCNPPKEKQEEHFTVEASDLNFDLYRNKRFFELYHTTEECFFITYYDTSQRKTILNYHDANGSITSRSFDSFSVIKNYGEQGLLYRGDSEVFKVNEAGVLWQKNGSIVQSNIHNPTQDGGYITERKEFVDEHWYSYLIKLDINGDVLWELGPYKNVKFYKELTDESIIFKYTLRGDDYHYIVRYSKELEELMEIKVSGLLKEKDIIITDRYVIVNNNNSLRNYIRKDRIDWYDLNGVLLYEYYNIENPGVTYSLRLLTFNQDHVYFLEGYKHFYLVHKINIEGEKETVFGPINNRVDLKHYDNGDVLLTYEDSMEINHIKFAKNGNISFHIIRDSDYCLIHYPEYETLFINEADELVSTLSKINNAGEVVWEIGLKEGSMLSRYFESSDEFFYLLYETTEGKEFVKYDKTGKLVNSTLISYDNPEIFYLKLTTNGNIVIILPNFNKYDLEIWSPQGKRLFQQELVGYVPDMAGDHKIFYTADNKGKFNKVTILEATIKFISNRYHYPF